MNNAPDRLEELKERGKVTGIDFIKIHPDQLNMDIYFYAFNDPNVTGPAVAIKDLLNDIALDDIHIYNSEGVVPDIPATNLSWSGDNILSVTVQSRGNFTLYKLFISDRKLPADPYRIDPFYNDVSFSFKANCPSDLDCAPPDHECPPEEPVDFPVDYLARDFWSFRRALLEFASLRYPDWPDRLEADAGVMLAEMMSAVGDEMAYYQDRVGREAYLETATQRRSFRKHAQLVDYHIHDGRGSFCWIDVTVRAGAGGNIPAGRNIWATGENGFRVDFETGLSLADKINNENYFVDFNRNEFDAYRWDEDQLCLAPGSTEMYINGWHEADLLTFSGAAPTRANGKWVLLKTKPDNPAQPARNWMVELIAVTNTTDPVLTTPITHLLWDAKQALQVEMDMTVLVVRGNIVPATSGKTHRQYFMTGADTIDLTAAEKISLESAANTDKTVILRAIEREGNNNSIAYRCTLIGSEDQNIVWLDRAVEGYSPEIHMEQLRFVSPFWITNREWKWRETLVGVSSSGQSDPDYTFEDGSWRRVIGYWRNGQEIVHEDYASNNGTTIRFGDNLFGKIPAEKTVFRVDYRIGGGRAANVAPGVINHFDAVGLAFIETMTNPIEAIGGKDIETAAEVKQSAPEAFRTIAYRAVRPEDYAEVAERLSWVQKAGATFRWTGSWLTAFVTPDPINAVAVTEPWRKDLRDQLNRYRQAGREAYTLDPEYADLDIEIDVCGSEDCYAGEIKERLLIKLFGKKGLVPVKGFFSPDRFTFGEPLERSVLEAAIQSVPGVKAVEKIRFRRRGYFKWKLFDAYYYDPGKNSIIRVENDPLHPERGILKLKIHGGA